MPAAVNARQSPAPPGPKQPAFAAVPDGSSPTTERFRDTLRSARDAAEEPHQVHADAQELSPDAQPTRDGSAEPAGSLPDDTASDATAHADNEPERAPGDRTEPAAEPTNTEAGAKDRTHRAEEPAEESVEVIGVGLLPTGNAEDTLPPLATGEGGKKQTEAVGAPGGGDASGTPSLVASLVAEQGVSSTTPSDVKNPDPIERSRVPAVSPAKPPSTPIPSGQTNNFSEAHSENAQASSPAVSITAETPEETTETPAAETPVKPDRSAPAAPETAGAVKPATKPGEESSPGRASSPAAGGVSGSPHPPGAVKPATKPGEESSPGRASSPAAGAVSVSTRPPSDPGASGHEQSGTDGRRSNQAAVVKPAAEPAPSAGQAPAADPKSAPAPAPDPGPAQTPTAHTASPAPAEPAPLRAPIGGPAGPTTPEPPGSLAQASARTMMTSVQRGLDVAMAQRGGEVNIRLAPESLGAVRITLNLTPGAVSASFAASTAEAAHTLSSNLAALRDSFEARGLRVDRLHVAPPTPQTHATESTDPRHDQPGARRDDPGDGRSRGRQEHRQGGHDPRQHHKPSVFKNQWQLALDATA